ncbi:unnamed protein product [Symbiodinium microadriaticum]|nr:unnamed protein product [Symbiodinium microadriaticum]
MATTEAENKASNSSSPLSEGAFAWRRRGLSAERFWREAQYGRVRRAWKEDSERLKGLSSSAVRGSPSSSPQLRLEATRCWLDKIVIGEKLCPFASSVQGSKLRLVASRAQDAEAVIEEVSSEAALLVGPAKIAGPRPETTLLVLDASLSCAAQWQDLVRLSWRLQAEAVCQQGFQDLLQIVLFHPSAMHSIYSEGFPDAADFTIRAPFPTVHLLREADVLKVQAYGPEAGEIPVRNKAKLRDQGLEVCRERLSSCLPPLSPRATATATATPAALGKEKSLCLWLWV